MLGQIPVAVAVVKAPMVLPTLIGLFMCNIITCKPEIEISNFNDWRITSAGDPKKQKTLKQSAQPFLHALKKLKIVLSLYMHQQSSYKNCTFTITKRKIPIRGHRCLQAFMADKTQGRISRRPQSLYVH